MLIALAVAIAIAIAIANANTVAIAYCGGQWQCGQPADQLRDHTGKKAKYWLILKEIIRAAPCFFLRVLAWY